MAHETFSDKSILNGLQRCPLDDDYLAGRHRKKKPTVMASNEVECDEAYVVAGHKGQPEVVKNTGRKGR